VSTGSLTPGQRFERTYPLDDRTAPRRARAEVAPLAGTDERLRRDLTIVVSELVANAVRHAPRVDGGEVVLAVIAAADVLRVEVSDPGDGFDPTPSAPAEGGLGLAIVGRIARSWGVEDGACTVVWCEVPIPSRAGAG
jgi:anti-sigma regulatory factor (Ser/Thr protein kinase)